MDTRASTHRRILRRRERTQNWSTEDKHLLLELIEPHLKVIESKNKAPRDRTEVWNQIHSKFNKASSNRRDLSRIIEQWRRMKNSAKMEINSYTDDVNSTNSEDPIKVPPSELSTKIWQLCSEVKQSQNPKVQKYNHALEAYLQKRAEIMGDDDSTQNEGSEISIKSEEISDIDSINGDSQNEYDEEKITNNESIEDSDTKRRKIDLSDHVKDDKSGVSEDLAHHNSTDKLKYTINVKPVSTLIQEKVPENITSHSQENQNLNADQIESRVKIEIFNIHLECAKIQRETVLNELKVSELKKQFMEKEVADKIGSQVRMVGERGAGAGKGGGGGGAIREAGGAFGKMEAAHEDQYFYNMQKEQIQKLREGLHDEISFHEEQIKRHQEAINRHKKRMADMEEK